MRLPGRLGLVGRTLTNMRLRQLRGIVERSARNHVLATLPIDVDERYACETPSRDAFRPRPVWENQRALRASLSTETKATHRNRVADAADGSLTFLNQTVELGAGPPAWNHDYLDDVPRLWLLKLHGFEPLSWLVSSVPPESEPAADYASTFLDWVASWRSHHPIGETAYLRRAWAPYAVSNRLLNWCRFYSWLSASGTTPSADLRNGIKKNASFLENHVEYDVDGNHLVVNGCALVMAGTLLPELDESLEEGLAVLVDAATDQFLPDGGHFERSPMYHVEMLKLYLTALDLCLRRDREQPEAIEAVCEDGLAFADAITPPDGRIPLLNDSVFGETLSLEALERYGSRVVTSRQPPGLDTGTSPSMSASGYFWIGGQRNRLLVDGGSVGPPHLPGHSHNDMLAVLLWVDGTRVISDTGTYNYEPGDRRRYARSVAGHSTVQVGEQEPIELGRRFLMGARTEPDSTFRTGDVDAFRGTYRTRRGYRHTRHVYGCDAWWFVWDRVTDARSEPVRSRLMLHPSVDVDVLPGDSEITLRHGDESPLAYVYPVRVGDVERTDGRYFPRFGAEHDRDVLQFHDESRTEGFGYVVSTTRTDEIGIRVEDGDPTALTMDRTTMEVPEI